MATPSEVRKFLQDFKEEVSRTGLDVIPTLKNRSALVDLNLIPYQRRQIILELTPGDYSEGPVPDESGRPGGIWKFGKPAMGVTIYIKIKLHCRAKCLSFHAAERPMVYPFRN